MTKDFIIWQCQQVSHVCSYSAYWYIIMAAQCSPAKLDFFWTTVKYLLEGSLEIRAHHPHGSVVGNTDRAIFRSTPMATRYDIRRARVQGKWDDIPRRRTRAPGTSQQLFEENGLLPPMLWTSNGGATLVNASAYRCHIGITVTQFLTLTSTLPIPNPNPNSLLTYAVSAYMAMADTPMH